MPLIPKHLDSKGGSGGGETLLTELQAGTRREAEEQVTFLVSLLPAFTAAPDDSGSWSSSIGQTCTPHPTPSRCPRHWYLAGSWGHRCSGGPRHLDRRTCAEQPQSLPQQPAPPTARAPERGRKANKDVLVSALLEAQEGGNQCLVNGKRENRSGKTVYFQAGERFVNSTGHCGGSTAGHKLRRGGGMLPERAQRPR